MEAAPNSGVWSPETILEKRISGAPFHIAMPGPTSVPNAVTSGPPLSRNALMRPPYVGSTDVTSLSLEEYLQKLKLKVTSTGDSVPAPFTTFQDTGFPSDLLINMYSSGFMRPKPIQAQTWPIILEGRDIVAIAETGAGKTLSYLVPAFIFLRHCCNSPHNGPIVLVVAPTQEAIMQIQDEVLKFGQGVFCMCLYGDDLKDTQLIELDRGPYIVVATPAQLNDMLEMKKIECRQVSLLVLDEADRMLDMGFEPQIRKIVEEITPQHRQTLMYAATWSKKVIQIANDLLVNHVQVNIGGVDQLTENKAITQYVEVVKQDSKLRQLVTILNLQKLGSKAIIFCSTRSGCESLCELIVGNRSRKFAISIHEDMSQDKRDEILNMFMSEGLQILVATDVDACGVDIKYVRVMINYDFPTGVEDYVHRIERTRKAGATCDIYTFLSDQDREYAADMINYLEGAGQEVTTELRSFAVGGNFGGPPRGNFGGPPQPPGNFGGPPQPPGNFGGPSYPPGNFGGPSCPPGSFGGPSYPPGSFGGPSCPPGSFGGPSYPPGSFGGPSQPPVGGGSYKRARIEHSTTEP